MSTFTIAAAASRSGLPESTLRYWERIGLIEPVDREDSSGHRRYSEPEVATLETLANLRAVGMSIEDMRGYLSSGTAGDASAGDRRALFMAHADRVRADIAALHDRLHYLELKVAYWTAREAGDLTHAAAVAEELIPVIRQIKPQEHTP